MDTAMQVALGTVKIRAIPIDPDNLRVTLIAEMEEKERLMDARAADQAEIAALKSELEQRHRRSERARHYGKMGKGVKKNS